jgi:fatty-acyl-CoA synthase
MLESLLRKRAQLADTVAVVDAETREEKTFSALDRESDAIAANLSSLGVKKGDRVATLMSKMVPHVEIFFALRKLGATLVPLNPALKKESVSSQMTRTSAKLIVDDFLGMGIGSEQVLATPKEDTAYTRVVGSTEDEAFVLFTGGSTGIPKGAIVHEGSVVWNSINTVLSWGLTKDDVAYLPFPLYHIGGWGIFLIPLFFCGGKVVVSSKFDADRTVDILHDYGITRFIGVPTMLYRVSSSPRFEEVDLGRVLFGCGGGALGKDVAQTFISKNYRIFQGYGATETGPNNFYISPESYSKKIGSVGKPMLFVEAKLSDEGELLIKGPHTFKGYLPGEEAAATSFDKEGFFHTGDLFTVDAEGDYTFAGRKKDMIKTGGENVYSVEVEEAINKLPYVSESAVVGVPHREWGEMVVGFVVLKAGEKEVGEEAVKNDLRKALPSFKVPKRVVFLKELPLSEMGKVQRYRLREKYEQSMD